MKASTAIKEIIDRLFWTKSRPTKHIGVTCQAIADRLDPRKSVRMDAAIEMLGVMRQTVYDMIADGRLAA